MMSSRKITGIQLGVRFATLLNPRGTSEPQFRQLEWWGGLLLIAPARLAVFLALSFHFCRVLALKLGFAIHWLCPLSGSLLFLTLDFSSVKQG